MGAISEKNRASVLNFLREKRASGVSHATTRNYFHALLSFDRATKGKPLRQAAPPDIIRWVEALRAEGKEEGSIKLYKTLFASYLKQSNGDAFAGEMQAALRHAKKRKRLPADSTIPREEVLAAANAAKSQMHRAMLRLQHEAALRIGENHALNVGSIALDGAGGADIVIPERNGEGGVKTGGRSVWVFESVPDLRLWLNMHPRRDYPEAPLWVGPDGKRLSITWMRQTIQGLFRAAGVKRRVWPHLLRHSRLTELAEKISESDLRIAAGWTPGSDMPAIYVHRTGGDVKRKMKRLHGVATEEEKAQEDRNPLAPVKCPDLTCGATNPAGFTYCGRCGGPLTAEAAKKRRESMEPRKKAAARAVAKGAGLTMEGLKEELRAQVLEELRADLVGK